MYSYIKKRNIKQRSQYRDWGGSLWVGDKECPEVPTNIHSWHSLYIVFTRELITSITEETAHSVCIMKKSSLNRTRTFCSIIQFLRRYNIGHWKQWVSVFPPNYKPYELQNQPMKQGMPTGIITQVTILGVTTLWQRHRSVMKSWLILQTWHKKMAALSE